MRKLASLLTFLLFSNILLAQDCLTGIVVDSKSKEPLEGAAIRMRGSNLGVTTANDGRFTICPQNTNQAVFIVSFLGYETREFEFPENQNITIELTSSPYKLERVVVTATLTPQSTWEVPAMVSVIYEVNVSNSPATNVDNFLRTIPNLFVDRSKGVFSKNASITMRGLDGSNRVLILYDGMPLNKTSYGFINWSLVSPDLVDQIEVVHGPSSALFGNNAMAGVINIRTKEPKNLPLYGSVIAEAGGFGFMGSRATVGGKFSVFGKDVRIMVNGFWREGDGYVAEPPEIRDSTNVPLYLKEKGLTYKMLIPSADSSHFYVSGNVYTDKRGAGRAVYLEDGSYDSYTTSRTQVGYRGNVSGFSVDMNAYVQYEVYNRQNESLNSTGDNYRIFHTDQISGDVGIWLSASKPLGKTNRFTFGADTKHGWMDAHDIYRTSTDQVVRYGKVTFGALFAQDELTLVDGKLKLLGGLRFDYAKFYDGLLEVTDPTKNTGFSSDTTANFPTSDWFSLNPKIGLRYIPNKWLSVYGSISSGFMPAKLDDLCSSRKITKGFKLANPELQPEHLLTYEAGGSVKLGAKVRLDAALFISNGTDFQYFVATGDSIDTGGTDIKPIVKRQNISSVQVYGGEFSVKATPTKWLIARGSYSFNHSKIKEFEINPALDTDLTGNFLAEVPMNQASVEVFFTNNRIANLGIIWTRIGPQWGDDVNSYKIEPWNTFDLRVWKEIYGVKLSMDIFDLLDNPYIDKKGLMSPGRYFLFTVGYSFN